jgi:hypothetical protein
MAVGRLAYTSRGQICDWPGWKAPGRCQKDEVPTETAARSGVALAADSRALSIQRQPTPLPSRSA